MKVQNKNAKAQAAKWLTVMAIAASPICSMGQSEAAKGSMPVNYNDCNYIVDQPENSGGYVVSADCKTIYVLKPKKGASTVRLTLNEDKLQDMCPLVEGARAYPEGLVAQLNKYKDELLKLVPNSKNEKRIAEIFERQRQIVEALSKNEDPYKNSEGGIAVVAFSAHVTQDLINQFYLLNKSLVRDHRVTFEPIKSNVGYFSFSDYDRDVRKMSSAIATNISGMKVPGEKNVFKVQDAASGQVVLSLGQACYIQRQINDAKRIGRPLTDQTFADIFAAELAPTLSYSYPVLSTISYHATLDHKLAVEMLLRETETKTAFTIDNLKSKLIEGGLTAPFKIEINLGDLGDRFTSEDDRKNFMEKLRNEVAIRLTTKLVETVEQITGAISVEDLDPSLTAPAPGHVDMEVGRETVCSSSSFAGITYSRRCSERAVIRRVPMNGQLDQIVDQIQRLNISISESVSISQDVPMAANTIF